MGAFRLEEDRIAKTAPKMSNRITSIACAATQLQRTVASRCWTPFTCNQRRKTGYRLHISLKVQPVTVVERILLDIASSLKFAISE